MPSLLDLKLLKDKASEFPDPIRSLILSEHDFLGVDDFLSRFSTWEKVLKLSEVRSNE